MKKAFWLAMLMQATLMPMQAQSLIKGAQFIDRIRPMVGHNLTSDCWGAPEVKPRYVDNGVEDDVRSYWGGNIFRGPDGKYYINIAGWPESSPNGHATWSSASRVYQVVSDNLYGPYTYVQELGIGHNADTYRARDGRYVTYIINGRYVSDSVEGPWVLGKYNFNLHDREVQGGTEYTVTLSNLTFAPRQDGSILALTRRGSIMISEDGVDDFHLVTHDSRYTQKNTSTLEDPVIWRDSVQYHMLVNDYRARYAYYSRSADGIHWVTEDGAAYKPGVAVHADGSVEDWYKLERPRIFQDEQGRAIALNLAVIDTIKAQDKGSDNHSSKNIVLPLCPGLMMTILNTEPISTSTAAIRVLIKGDDEVNAQTDLDLSTMRFGSHKLVNYGQGATVTASEPSGERDIIVTFSGSATGIAADEFAPKMIAQLRDGSTTFAYARMPQYDYAPALLIAMKPSAGADNRLSSIRVENYGVSASAPQTVQVKTQSGLLLATADVPAIEPYQGIDLALSAAAAVPAGTTALNIAFIKDGNTVDTNTLSTAATAALQEQLQQVIDSAKTIIATGQGGKAAISRLSKKVTANEQFTAAYDALAVKQAIGSVKNAITAYYISQGQYTEYYDFYAWAMTDGAAITMSTATETITLPDGTSQSLPLIDRISDGTNSQTFEGRIAFQYGSSYLNLRNKGTNNASSGLFDYNRDAYLSVRNLKAGDKVTFVITGNEATFTDGTAVVSGKTYTITDEKSLDLKCVHYTTIKSIKVETTTEVKLPKPVLTLKGLEGEDNHPVVSATVANQELLDVLEADVDYTFNGTPVEAPFTFAESGELIVTISTDGYESTADTITFSGKYILKEDHDFTAITEATLAEDLGSAWTYSPTATRWAFWANTEQYYVASISQSGNISLGSQLTTDQGKSLLLGYGIGRNATSGQTSYWIADAADDAIAIYDVNKQRAPTTSLTRTYVTSNDDPMLKIAVEANYTLAKAAYFVADNTSTAIRSLAPAAAPQTVYNLAGQRVTNSYRGIVIVGGKAYVRN